MLAMASTKPLRLQIVSDLHREHVSNAHDPAPDIDVLIAAGDIDNGTNALPWLAMHKAKRKIYVPGNHEFYGRCMISTRAALRSEAVRLGIDLLDNDVVEIEGVAFVGSTLWSDFLVMRRDHDPDRLSEPDRVLHRLHASRYAQQRMNDYRVIRFGERLLLPSDTLRLHQDSVAFVDAALSAAKKPTVVVTHHGPTPESIHPQYDDNSLNGAFVSDLRPLISRHAPVLWVHGHTHSTIDYVCGRTRVVANPHGYTAIENPRFRRRFVLELDPANGALRTISA